MNLNLTLPFQIIHFLIAYWALRRWLFAPLFACLVRDQEQERNERERLAAYQEQTAALRQEQELELAACASYFASNKPIIEEKPPVEVATPFVEIPDITPSQRAQLQHELVAALVKKAEQ
jgi:hypothetical protein